MPEPTLTIPTASEMAPEAHPAQAFFRFLRAVRYRKGPMIVVMAAAMVLGGLYYTTATRIYSSNASLLILPTGDAWSADMTSGSMTQDRMTTYRQMVSSEVVLEEALKQLPPNCQIDLANAPRENWVRVLQGNLSVTSARKTNIINIGYSSKDPQAAAAVVDAVLSAYLTFTKKLQKSTADELLSILVKEQSDLESRLKTKKAALTEARKNSGELLFQDGDNVNVLMNRVIRFNDTWIEARIKRDLAASQFECLKRAIHNGEDLQQHALSMIKSVGNEVLLRTLGFSSTDAQTISRINQQLLADRSKLASMFQFYGDNHHKVRELQGRIAAAEEHLSNRSRLDNSQLGGRTQQELAPLLMQFAQQALNQALEHERRTFQSYEEANNLAMSLDQIITKRDELEQECARLNKHYDQVIARLNDIDLGQDNSSLRTRVLSRPEVRLVPISPRLARIVLLSLLSGIGGGLLLVYLQDLLDDRFRSPEELQMQLGIPVLAMVRKMEPVADRGIEAIHAHMRPNAVETEAFRTLRTALALSENSVERLVVSSSEPGDGKTTITVNLATTYAQSGKRTLLIDADMRRPGLTPLLNLRGSQGLSAVLREGLPIAEAAEANVVSQLIDNLDVLPSGPRPGNPTELLSAERFSELLAWAETHYDQILIDSPPALVSDTAIIGRMVDGVLLTVRPEKNRRRTVIRAAESFPSMGIRVVGIVINHLAQENAEGYYGYGYGNGYGYGYGYGHEEDAAESDHLPEAPIRPARKDIPRAA